MAAQFEKLVVGSVEDAVEHAYREGEEGSIRLSITERLGRLEIQVRDYGMPQDVGQLERQVHEGDISRRTLYGCPAELLDEVHWLAYGPGGKALQVCKWLHERSVVDVADAASLEPFQKGAPLATEQQYTVRKMLPAEAVQVSQLMYRTYGGTYFNPDVYYPQRIVAHNANGSAVSFVACSDDGYVAGHSALELNQPGPVAETGQAAVDPAHRGRGLLRRMKDLALAEAESRELVGWYADAVAVHTLTQKSNVDHGGRLTGVDLAISPKTERFRGFAAEQPQRVTCLLYFHWLSLPTDVRSVFVPERQRAIVQKIYENLECRLEFGRGAAPEGHGTLAVRVDPGAGTAFARADQLGADTAHAVRHAKRELVERSAVQVVYVELPLADRGTPSVMEQLENFGFAFAGIAPHFSTRGDLVRLVYLVEPLEREPIKTYDGWAGELVDYALAEQVRVQSAL